MNKVGVILSVLFVVGLGVLFYFFQNQPEPTIPNEDLSLQFDASTNQTNLTPGQQALTTPLPISITPEPTSGPGKPATVATSAAIITSKGTITVELYSDVAPKTVTNFVTKANSSYYNNLLFHRVEDWVVQGGDPKGTGTGGGDMVTEFNDKPFVVGSLGVARRNDPKVQNDSQFFITKSDASWLNNQYTNFGMVIDGMDVVNKIAIGDKILRIEIK